MDCASKGGGDLRFENPKAPVAFILSLFPDASAIPPVNNMLLQGNVFGSPFFQSKRGSGVVMIRKGDKKMVLGFNVNARTEQKK